CTVLHWTCSVFHAYGGHAVPFAPTAGTQCLSRLRRARSAFRAYGGHTVPFAPTAGTQCLSRLRRAHSAFHAYGGHKVPLSPTAFPTEANRNWFVLCST